MTVSEVPSTTGRLRPVDCSYIHVDDPDRVDQAVDRIQTQVNRIVRPLLENSDNRLRVLHRNHGLVAVQVDDSIADDVYRAAGVVDPELQRGVRNVHSHDIKHLVRFTSGGTPSTTEFVLQANPEEPGLHRFARPVRS